MVGGGANLWERSSLLTSGPPHLANARIILCCSLSASAPSGRGWPCSPAQSPVVALRPSDAPVEPSPGPGTRGQKCWCCSKYPNSKIPATVVASAPQAGSIPNSTAASRPPRGEGTPSARCCKAYAGSRVRGRLSEPVGTPPALCCMRICTLPWISGTSARKAPTVVIAQHGARHGMAWRGLVRPYVWSQRLGHQAWPKGNSRTRGIAPTHRLILTILPHRSMAKRTASHALVPARSLASCSKHGRACQLPARGPVRRAARARSISHHSHHDLASRICKLSDKPPACASAPQPAKLNPAPAVILSLRPRLARRFARSLHLHPYY